MRRRKLMTYEEKIKFLCEYHNLEEKIKAHLERATLYRKCADEPNSPQYGPKAKPSNPNTEAPFLKWIKRAEDEDQAAEKLKPLLIEAKQRIISVITTLNDTELSNILMLRYIDWLSWKEIQERLYLSESTRKRKHRAAIQALEIKNVPS